MMCACCSKPLVAACTCPLTHALLSLAEHVCASLPHLLLLPPAQTPHPPPSAGEDRRAGAARCLGELVRKLGERVLARMLPILRDNMASGDAATRQGVCTGLQEVRRQRPSHWTAVLHVLHACVMCACLSACCSLLSVAPSEACSPFCSRATSHAAVRHAQARAT